MLRKLTEFILPDKRPPRECEACGQPFLCGAWLKGCWCLQIKLSAEVRQQLRERYKDCLCPDCLKRLAEENTDQADVTDSRGSIRRDP